MSRKIETARYHNGYYTSLSYWLNHTACEHEVSCQLVITHYHIYHHKHHSHIDWITRHVNTRSAASWLLLIIIYIIIYITFHKKRISKALKWINISFKQSDRNPSIMSRKYRKSWMWINNYFSLYINGWSFLSVFWLWTWGQVSAGYYSL